MQKVNRAATDAAPAPNPPAGRQAFSQPTQRRAPQTRGNFAAIDLGTNNCRLLIARPSADGFTVIDAFSRIVRLGEGLSASGELSNAAIERAVSALSVCADKLRRRHVTLARSVATEACRQARNGEAFIDRVARETGIMLDIISAQEEARLAVLGCQSLLEPGEGHALIFDIGGGSTELVLVDASTSIARIVDWHSAPWGVVSLMERVSHHPDTVEGRAAAYAEMRLVAGEAFAAIAARLATVAGPRRLLGTSGTVTTLASVHLGLARYDRRAIDGLVLPSDAMRAIASDLGAKSIADRRLVPCIGHERADLVVAGCAILEAILDIWPTETLGIADRGIREGILRSLMDADRAARSEARS